MSSAVSDLATGRAERSGVRDRLNPSDDGTRSLVFCHMWVVSSLFQMLHRADILAGPIQVLALMAALTFFTYPRRVAYFFVFLVSHLCLYLVHAPDTGNHALFMFIVELAMVSAWLVGRARGFDEWFETIAPVVRLATVLLYFFAFFHKLNTGYLSPESCGAIMPWGCLSKFAEPFGHPDEIFMPKEAWPLELRHAGIYGSLLFEGAIPILLAFRRTWLLGFGMGFALHFFLGACFFWHFTALLWSVYFLFAPPAVIDELARQTRRGVAALKSGCGLIGLRPTPAGVLIATIVGLSIVALATTESPELRRELARYTRVRNAWNLADSGLRTWIGWVPFLAYSLWLLAVVVKASWRRPFDAAGGSQWRFPNRGLAVVFAGVIVLNGFTPYLGIKNHQSFAMFSGLETHGGANNHLFMPLVEVADFQRDIVEPLSDSRSIFGVELEGDYARPMRYRELLQSVKNKTLRGRSGVHVEFRRDGVEMVSDGFETDPRYLADEPSWIERKFLLFRPIPVPGRSPRCSY